MSRQKNRKISIEIKSQIHISERIQSKTYLWVFVVLVVVAGAWIRSHCCCVGCVTIPQLSVLFFLSVLTITHVCTHPPPHRYRNTHLQQTHAMAHMPAWIQACTHPHTHSSHDRAAFAGLFLPLLLLALLSGAVSLLLIHHAAVGWSLLVCRCVSSGLPLPILDDDELGFDVAVHAFHSQGFAGLLLLLHGLIAHENEGDWVVCTSLVRTGTQQFSLDACHFSLGGLTRGLHYSIFTYREHQSIIDRWGGGKRKEGGQNKSATQEIEENIVLMASDREETFNKEATISSISPHDKGAQAAVVWSYVAMGTELTSIFFGHTLGWYACLQLFNLLFQPVSNAHTYLLTSCGRNCNTFT